MLAYFKLSEDLWDLYPNTFSGGERLRLNLAHTMEEIVEMAEKNKVIIREYADKYNLFLTGGSDCHGKYEPNSPEVGDYIAEQSGAEKIVN